MQRGDDDDIVSPRKPATRPTQPIEPDSRKPDGRRPDVDRSGKGVSSPSSSTPVRGDPSTIDALKPARGADDGSTRPSGRDPIDAGKTPTREPVGTAIEPVALPKRPTRGANGDAFVGDSAYGVPLAPRDNGGVTVVNGGSGNVSVTQNIRIDNRTYVDYVTNVSVANGWGDGWRGHGYGRWRGPSCGGVRTWHDYNCSGGLAISVGFGDGFHFGFFYGSSCAPLCSSWCNPWWDGYATSWTCAPTACGWWSPWRICWDPCRPFWWSGYRCGPCPLPAWTPCYAYSPIVCSSVVYTAGPAVVAPPPLPSPGTLWRELGDGYDREAEDGFRRLADVDPLEAEWALGLGLARAFRGEIAWASENLRQSFATEAGVAGRAPVDARLSGRLVALEDSLSSLVRGASPSIDALLVVAASQALRGDIARAYFTATTAQAEGDRSAGTAAFVAWLNEELRRDL